MNIGLTYTGSHVKQQHYETWLKSNNENIQVKELSVTRNNADLINDCDALVLSGGVDIYPGFYGSNNFDYANKPVDGFQKTRDEFEMDILQSALEKKIPILAICRGLQLVNTVMGGSLKQDNGYELNQIHKGDQLLKQDRIHKVVIETGTLLHSITGVDKTVANSAHHQSIESLGNNLMINSVAEDRTIEGIEWKDKNNTSFMLGVQWHPERMYQFHLQDNPLSKKIRDYFIEEIKKHKTKTHD